MLFFIIFASLKKSTMKSLKRILFITVIGIILSSFTIEDNTLNQKSTNSNSAGTLRVSTLTSNAGGNYAPRNIVAIWVEDASGNYVKTLLVYANNYKQYLTHWKSKSQYDRTDAISGATVNSHATRVCNWDGTNTTGVVVPDGTYRICFELTDKNATGNYSYFEIEKDSLAHSLSPANVPSFSNISIIWTPESINDIMEYSSHIQCSIAPNPNYGQFKLQLTEVPEKATIEFYNALGQLIQVENIENSSETYDLKPHTGMIFYTIVSENRVVFRGKIIVR